MTDASHHNDDPSKPPRRFHRLRVAASLFFVVVLYVLFVFKNSSWMISRNFGPHTAVGVNNAYAYVIHSSHPYALDRGELPYGWAISNGPTTGRRAIFRWTTGVDGTTVTIPFWFFAWLAGICAMLPWVPQRYTLRTLLVATTLVAVALVLLQYAVR